MKEALLWDFKEKKYNPVMIDDSCYTYCDDMNKIVKCTNCGKKTTYGRMYTSIMYHNCIGFGYPVCEECYKEEWKLEIMNRRED